MDFYKSVESAFVDLLENNSDLDLSWGDYFQQSLYIIWNIGDIFNPVMDNGSIVTQFPFSSPVNTAGLNLPSFVDIDNDHREAYYGGNGVDGPDYGWNDGNPFEIAKKIHDDQYPQSSNR